MPECAIMAKHQYFNLSSKFLVFSQNNVQTNFAKMVLQS
jgi:hypothetical protein